MPGVGGVPAAPPAVRALAAQALTRAAGAPLVGGNAITVLRDAAENFPCWLEAIAGAQRSIHLENYIIARDAVGERFVDALAARARAGVRVRVLFDWMGTPRHGWILRALAGTGAEARVFNPPALDAPLGWLVRDHRKTLTVDGRVSFVSGLCLSARWEGDPGRGVRPWRDTGVVLAGPAVADVDEAFARAWAAAGGVLPPEEIARMTDIAPAGEASVRVIATEPATAGLYRLDLLIASLARATLWLTDAYFVGMAPYVAALRAAATDGVDVRLLVPGTSDIGAVPLLSRAGYRPLLQAGVRVFEWNGSMIHAKTAVADGRWARVGSSNLNLASWLGNWELDLAIEDAGVGATMEQQYQEDLEGATEVVLDASNHVRPRAARRARQRRVNREAVRGSARGAALGALRLTSAMGAAIADRRVLGPAEGRAAAASALVLAALSAIAWLWPQAVAWPLSVVGAWIAVTLLVRTARRARGGGAGGGA